VLRSFKAVAMAGLVELLHPEVVYVAGGGR
jgi:hypothetical protein